MNLHKKDSSGKVGSEMQTSVRSLETGVTYVNMISAEEDEPSKDTAEDESDERR